MEDHRNTRAHAVERLHTAREHRASCSQQHDSARGSIRELPASTELAAAEEQCAAREAWLKWIDRDY